MAQNPKKKPTYTVQKDLMRITDTTQWLTQNEYDIITRRQKYGVMPVLVVDCPNFIRPLNNALDNYATELTRKLHQKVNLKTSLHYGEKTKHLIFYIDGNTPQNFYTFMPIDMLTLMDELDKGRHSANYKPNSIYIINPDLTLTHISKFDKYDYPAAEDAVIRAKIIEYKEPESTDEEDKTEQIAEETAKAEKQPKLRWKWSPNREDRPKYEKKPSTRQPYVPRYVRNFNKLMEHYGIDPSIPLLPMAQTVLEHVQEPVEPIAVIEKQPERRKRTTKTADTPTKTNAHITSTTQDEAITSKNKQPKTARTSKPRAKKQASDEPKRMGRQIDPETAREIEEYLATLPADKAEKIRQDKNEMYKVRQHIYGQRYAAKKKAQFEALPPEEQERITQEKRKIYKEKYEKHKAVKKAELEAMTPEEQAKALEETRQKYMEDYRQKQVRKKERFENATPEEREKIIEKNKARNKIDYQKKKAKKQAKLDAMTPEELAKAQEKIKQQNKKQYEKKRDRRQERFDALTPEEQERVLEERRAKDREAKRKSRARIAAEKALAEQKAQLEAIEQQQSASTQDEGMTR